MARPYPSSSLRLWISLRFQKIINALTVSNMRMNGQKRLAQPRINSQ